jgi:hypothetical protein
MRVAFVVTALVVLFSPFGCTSILGDFNASSSSGGPPGDDGGGSDVDATQDGDAGDSTSPGTDSGQGDVVSPVDAPEEPDAPPPMALLCNAWQSASPLALIQIPPDDSGGGGNNNGLLTQFYVEHLASNSARIVVNSSGYQSSSTTVFTVSEQGGGMSSMVFPGTNLQTELRAAVNGADAGSPNATAMVFQDSNGNYDLYAIADTDPGNNVGAETPIATVPPPPSVGNGNFNLTTTQRPTGDYYTLASYESSTAGEYDLAAWDSTGNTWQVLQQGAQVGLSAELVSNGTTLYGFFPPPGTGNNGPAPISQFTFPPGGGAPTSRAITTGTETGATFAAAQSSAGYEIAFVLLNGAQSISVVAGVVPLANINTFIIDNLTTYSFLPGGDAGLFNTTTVGNNGPGSGARWMRNGFFGTMGKGGTGGTSNFTGLNFYVADTSGQWLVAAAGNGQNLLAGQPVQQGAFDLANAFNLAVVSFDVAWSEVQDGTTTLYYNQLQCVAP